MAQVCGDRFLHALSHSSLLEEGQRADLAELGQRFPEPRDLAQELMRRDWLTPYQVNQIFLGRTNELILGNYILLARVGEGGMGQVFRARQRRLNRTVAIKVIRKEALDNPKVISRFEREIRALAQLAHPNIVHAYDADHVDGTHFYVMEYVDGVDLARLVKQSGPLAVDQACDYIRQAALGLQQAHERGMVHRDIKPANLLVTWTPLKDGNKASSGMIARPGSGLMRRPGSGLLPRPSANPGAYPFGLVKLLDLGLAKWEDDTRPFATMLTQIGSFMGTPDFIAPEQARDSRSSDIRSDLYSLGCTFYYLLTAQVPFPNGSVTEKLMQHQFDPPEAVEHVRRTALLGGAPANRPHELVEVPARVRALLERMLAKRPEDRPQTPAAVATALSELARQGAMTRVQAETTVAEMPADAKPQAAAPGLSASSTFAFTKETKGGAKPRSRGRGLIVGLCCALGLATFLLLSLVAGRSWPEEETSQKKQAPAERPAELAWKRLQARAKQIKANVDAWRDELIAFRMQHPGSPEGVRIGAALAALPSALDRVADPRLLPKWQKFEWQPPELIAIVGDRLDKKRRAALCVAFSPDGRWLATGSEDNVVRLFDTAQLLWPTRLAEHVHRVTCLAFSPDGKVLASGSGDGAVIVWDTKGSVLKRLDGFKDAVTALTFSPDGTILAGCSADGLIKLHTDPLRGGDVRTLEANAGRLLCLAFSPDGRLLVSGTENKLASWEIAARERAMTPQEDVPLPGGEVKVAAFSLDGKTLVTGVGNGTLYLCDVRDRRLTVRQTLSKHTKLVNDVAFAPDGKTFLSAGEDESVKMWNTATGAVVREWSDLRFAVNGVAWAPDGRHVAFANANSTVYLLRLTKPPDTPFAN